MYISSDPALRGARQEKLRTLWWKVCVAPPAVCQYIRSCVRICCPSTNMFLLYIYILYIIYIYIYLLTCIFVFDFIQKKTNDPKMKRKIKRKMNGWKTLSTKSDEKEKIIKGKASFFGGSSRESWLYRMHAFLSKSKMLYLAHLSISWNKGISLTKPPFGVISCEVATIWPDLWPNIVGINQDIRTVILNCYALPKNKVFFQQGGYLPDTFNHLQENHIFSGKMANQAILTWAKNYQKLNPENHLNHPPPSNWVVFHPLNNRLGPSVAHSTAQKTHRRRDRAAKPRGV